MFAKLLEFFKFKELKSRVLYTLALLVLCRIGAYIPVPGINSDAAIELFRSVTGGALNLFQLMDVFSGGAFAQMTVAALGVTPYISASIIFQVLMLVMPSLQREMKESPDHGRRKMGRWIRMLTVGIAFFQATVFARYVVGLNAASPGLLLTPVLSVQLFGVPWLFYLTMAVTMTTATTLLMWIGEQISEKGIGNGISLIITVGILSSFPTTLGNIVRQLNLDSQEAGQLSLLSVVLLLVLFVFIILGTILIIQAQRKIPLQYARRIVGRHEVQGGSANIPLKVNYAGVVPVIFASSLLMFPATIAQFLGQGSWLGRLAGWLSPGSNAFLVFYAILIIFFTYVWTAAQFHPEQIASEMKKNGAFIPGVRQGKPTQDFLEMCMSRITLLGALCLALIAVLPNLIGKLMGLDASITYFFGGTSLLILVGVVLDTMKQMQSQMLSKKYEGYLRKSRGRS